MPKAARSEATPQIAKERAPGSIGRALRWLDSKLSRVTSSREFIPEIDGLRFIAVFFIVVFHAAGHVLEFSQRPPLLQQWTPGRSLFPVVIGNLFLGVQIFFVISGLVVALPFARSAIQDIPKPSLRRYFMRRLTRIEPPYILALLAMYYLRVNYRLDLRHLLVGLLYLHGWHYGYPNPLNPVTWTLEVEVVFYLLAPWITSIYSIPDRTLRWSWQLLFITGDSYFVHSWLLPFGPPMENRSFMAALPFFLAGILLADLYVSGVLSRSNRFLWDGAALLSLATLFFCRFYGPAWRFAWSGPMMIMILVAGGIRGVAVNRFLRFRPITLIGGMCYTIYLWHIPIMSRLDRLTVILPHGLSDHRLAALYCLYAVPLVLLSSMPIYYFTERPFMNGPGSRLCERFLRRAYGHLESTLARFASSSKRDASPLTESVSQEHPSSS